MILLNDFLNISESDLKRTKIRFNQSNNEDFEPVELFKNRDSGLYNGHFWNGQNKSFKEGQIVIGFIRLSLDKWLLFDVSVITKDLDVYNGPGYEYETIETYRKYFGRVIVKYKNKAQQMVRRAESVINECEVYEIIPDTFEDNNFPGYENVDISWNELKRVIEKKDWKTALENQKGVYLITDIATGKRYIGSAYGEEMLLGRWKDYVRTGHGGNKDLKKLNLDYIMRNFRYSILEVYKSTTDDKTIIHREHHWMKILMSKNKEYGYNN